MTAPTVIPAVHGDLKTAWPLRQRLVMARPAPMTRPSTTAMTIPPAAPMRSARNPVLRVVARVAAVGGSRVTVVATRNMRSALWMTIHTPHQNTSVDVNDLGALTATASLSRRSAGAEATQRGSGTARRSTPRLESHHVLASSIACFPPDA